MSIIPSEQPPESGELIELVDRYLDQRLDDADVAALLGGFGTLALLRRRRN